MMIETSRTTLTKEEGNLYKYYNALLSEGNPPSYNEYAPFGEDLGEIAVEMFKARAENGTSGLKKYMVALTRLKDAKHKRVVLILSGGTPPESSPTTVEVTRDEQLFPPLPEQLMIAPGRTHSLCPLKDAYIAYSREKSPEGYSEFHASCFWGMLSIVAARRVVIDLARRQHTPLTIMLAARSTLYAKTDTAEVVRDVLKASGLDWMLGLTRTTPQKLLHDMTGPIPENYAELPVVSDETLSQEVVQQRLAMSGQRGWHYNEFGKLVKAMVRSSGAMADFVEILLQLSDCPDSLPTGTISRGSQTIMKPYLSITGTLTPASIKAVAGRNAELWSDGFFARMLFSCPPPDGYIDSPFKRGNLPVPGLLAKGVRDWHERLGVAEIGIEPVCDEEGKETGRYNKIVLKELPEVIYGLSDAAYDGWTRYRSALKAMTAQFGTTDFDGSYGRLSIMALRVAALAASVENASQIAYEHWLLGQEQAEMWRSSLHQLYAQVNSDETPTAGPTLEDVLASYMQTLEKPATAREIMQYGPGPLRKLRSREIQEILDCLEKSGVVECERKGKATWYKCVS